MEALFPGEDTKKTYFITYGPCKSIQIAVYLHHHPFWSFPMLASVCPKCGKKFAVAAIVAYPTPKQEKEMAADGFDITTRNTFGLIAVDANGDGHCSFYEGDYESRQEADAAGADMTEDDILAMAEEDRYLDEDYGDYGPPDSDPHDRDYAPYC